MLKSIVSLAAILALALVSPSIAEKADSGHQHKAESKAKKAVKTGSITGVVVDLACEMLGEEPGPGHQACATGGVPIGLLDKEGRIWIAISDKYGSPNEMLLPLMGKNVKAEGWYVRKPGVGLISISKVAEVK